MSDHDDVYTFCIQSSVCHRIGSLLPLEDQSPAFAQLYYYDRDLDDRVHLRMSTIDGTDLAIVCTLEVVEELNVGGGCVQDCKAEVERART